jgi:hypothetical protein
MNRYQLEPNLTDSRRHSTAGRAVTVSAPRLSPFRIRVIRRVGKEFGLFDLRLLPSGPRG